FQLPRSMCAARPSLAPASRFLSKSEQSKGRYRESSPPRQRFAIVSALGIPPPCFLILLATSNYLDYTEASVTRKGIISSKRSKYKCVNRIEMFVSSEFNSLPLECTEEFDGYFFGRLSGSLPFGSEDAELLARAPKSEAEVAVECLQFRLFDSDYT